MPDLSNAEYEIGREDSKRSRKYNAVKLPPEIKEYMIPKYVVYYRECYNREKNLFREFFKIERHPCCKRLLTSSKSTKIPILEKLEQIKQMLENLETSDNVEITIEDTSGNTTNERITLPKYISLKKQGDKQYLIYDRRIKIGNLEDNRVTYKMLLAKDGNFKEQLATFLKNLTDKI